MYLKIEINMINNAIKVYILSQKMDHSNLVKRKTQLDTQIKHLRLQLLPIDEMKFKLEQRLFPLLEESYGIHRGITNSHSQSVALFAAIGKLDDGDDAFEVKNLIDAGVTAHCYECIDVDGYEYMTPLMYAVCDCVCVSAVEMLLKSDSHPEYVSSKGNSALSLLNANIKATSLARNRCASEGLNANACKGIDAMAIARNMIVEKLNAN